MAYAFLVDTYETERLKTLSVWSMFADDDLPVRRVAHTAHHRGQLTAMLRMLNRELHSTYGPTADTGGLIEKKAAGGAKSSLPGTGDKPVTERPEAS